MATGTPSDVEGTALGNVYEVGESPTFEISADGEVDWRVENYWGQTVASGTTDAAGGATLTIDHSTPGYYELTVGSGDGAITRSFAIVRPHEFSQYDESFFAMQGHFAKGYPIEIMPLIQTVGAKHFRDSHKWDVLEKEKGQFTYPKKHTRMMQRAEELDLDPLLVMSFGNTLYYPPAEGTSRYTTRFTAPYDETGREAYANYVRAVVSHYPDLQTVEIWNEYNHDGHFSRGPAAGDPAAYAKTLEYGYDAAKDERSSVTVLGGATGGIPYDWLEDVLQNDGAEHMDAMSVHPYRRRFAPEQEGVYGFQEAETDSIGTLEEELNELQELTAEYNGGDPLPIWITEYGYLTRNTTKTVSVVEQTMYLPRSYVMAQTAGVERFYWYQFRAQETGNGLIRPAGHPKGGHAARPAYVAYATMTRQLTGATPQGRESLTIEDDSVDPETVRDQFYSYRYTTPDGSPLRVLWSLADTTATVETDQPLTVTDMMGRRQTYQPTDGTVELQVSGEPLYVEGSVSDIAVAVPAELLTDLALQGGRISDVDARSGVADLRITNHGKRSLALRETRWQLGDDSATTDGATAIDAGGETTVSMPAESVPFWQSQDLTVEADFGDRGTVSLDRSVSFNPAWQRSITIDGNAEVDSTPGLDLGVRGTDVEFSNSDGGSVDARLWMTHDEEHVYLTAIVEDDTYHTPDAPWKGDALRVGFAPGWEPEAYDEMSQHTIAKIDGEVVIGPPNSGIDATVKRHEDRSETVYELAIDRSAIGADGATAAVGFDAMIIDNDGGGRANGVYWQGAVTDLNDPSLLAPVHLVDAAGDGVSTQGGDGGGDAGQSSAGSNDSQQADDSDSTTETSANNPAPALAVALVAVATLGIALRRRF
jgi:hypothetical protein